MSDTTGADLAGADNAAGGTPAEHDLPAMQGLDDSVDDPSDPTASRGDAEQPDVAALAEASGADDEGPSDPMPDMSGTSGG
jgi:hypothetical protein